MPAEETRRREQAREKIAQKMEALMNAMNTLRANLDLIDSKENPYEWQLTSDRIRVVREKQPSSLGGIVHPR